VLSTPNIESPISLAQFIRTGQYRWFTEREYKVDGHITPISTDVLNLALLEAGFINIKIEAIAPLQFKGLAWWKMRAFSWILQKASGRRLMDGDIMICQASKPVS
jgi:hypothetical protein